MIEGLGTTSVGSQPAMRPGALATAESASANTFRDIDVGSMWAMRANRVVVEDGPSCR